jgi:hypothetical protein
MLGPPRGQIIGKSLTENGPVYGGKVKEVIELIVRDLGLKDAKRVPSKLVIYGIPESELRSKGAPYGKISAMVANVVG